MTMEQSSRINMQAMKRDPNIIHERIVEVSDSASPIAFEAIDLTCLRRLQAKIIYHVICDMVIGM